MKRIAFHDRERETEEIMKILDAEPSLITFIYGPINSGKTMLVSHLISQLPEEYVVFYINLRGRFISDYRDFIRVLFKIERGKNYKEVLKTILEVSAVTLKFSGIPVAESVMNALFKEKSYEDVFEFLEDYFTTIAKNKRPVLIIDELQVVGDLKIDGLLMYKLFNFFIRLTKELHLCHIFAVSSDSLAIVNIYSEAMLDGRCRYLLVDDFDYGTAAALLEEHGFTDDEKVVAWEYCGGKPGCLMEILYADNRERTAKDMLRTRVTQLKDLLDYLDYTKPRITIGDDEYMVKKKDITDILNRFLDTEYIDDAGLNRPAKHFLIKDNILFLDPHTGIIKSQSRLDLLAIREVMKNV
ncbi:MAG: putative ATP-binding protein [Candidatus Methanoperedenaceae archaeon GB50]|nr:MAG: putative ATP-binding protein [Candidatus Methanoperedenaceae archaeon GB50]